jgi:hypothetical protein
MTLSSVCGTSVIFYFWRFKKPQCQHCWFNTWSWRHCNESGMNVLKYDYINLLIAKEIMQSIKLELLFCLDLRWGCWRRHQWCEWSLWIGTTIYRVISSQLFEIFTPEGEEDDEDDDHVLNIVAQKLQSEGK